jgi:hypothetical protein
MFWKEVYIDNSYRIYVGIELKEVVEWKFGRE